MRIKMHKNKIYIVIMLSLILMFTGCSKLSKSNSDKNVLKQSIKENEVTDNADAVENNQNVSSMATCRNIEFKDSDMYAAAYLGYQDSSSIDYYKENYLNSDTIDTLNISGEEYYLIIPKTSNMKVKVYKQCIENDELDLIKEFDKAVPFIVCCNISDIFPDCKIVMTSEDGSKTTEFSPFISLKDGSVQIGDDGIDITKAD